MGETLETTDVAADQLSGRRLTWPRWRGLLLVFIAASFWPLTLMAVNPIGIIRPERVLLVVFVTWMGGVLLILALNLAGVHLEVAENTSFITIALVMSAGPIVEEYGDVAFSILVLPLVFGWLFTRLRGRIIVPALVWGMAVALAVGPATALAGSLGSEAPSVYLDPAEVSVELSTRPDIFLFVFDGYPGLVAADMEGADPGVIDAATELRDRGYEVPQSAWSAYWTTALSIPSALEMAYPAESELWEEPKTLHEIQQVISGENALVETLRAHGYQTHMLESGWSGATCGRRFDTCVPSPWLDEATFLTLRHTLAWAWIKDSSGPHARGTLAAFDWLLQQAPSLSESDTPDFVFAHIMVPHAPYFFRSDCTIEVNEQRGGVIFDEEGIPPDIRERYLIEQIDCADAFMLEFADRIGPDDAVIFMSDHGTDRRHQARPEWTEWDDAAIVERMNSFLAVRLPGCSIGDEILIPNIFRRILGCYSSTEIGMLPERMWINPMKELEPDVVDALIHRTP